MALGEHRWDRDRRAGEDDYDEIQDDRFGLDGLDTTFFRFMGDVERAKGLVPTARLLASRVATREGYGAHLLQQRGRWDVPVQRQLIHYHDGLLREVRGLSAIATVDLQTFDGQRIFQVYHPDPIVRNTHSQPQKSEDFFWVGARIVSGGVSDAPFYCPGSNDKTCYDMARVNAFVWEPAESERYSGPVFSTAAHLNGFWYKEWYDEDRGWVESDLLVRHMCEAIGINEGFREGTSNILEPYEEMVDFLKEQIKKSRYGPVHSLVRSESGIYVATGGYSEDPRRSQDNLDPEFLWETTVLGDPLLGEREMSGGTFPFRSANGIAAGGNMAGMLDEWGSASTLINGQYVILFGLSGMGCPDTPYELIPDAVVEVEVLIGNPTRSSTKFTFSASPRWQTARFTMPYGRIAHEDFEHVAEREAEPVCLTEWKEGPSYRNANYASEHLILNPITGEIALSAKNVLADSDFNVTVKGKTASPFEGSKDDECVPAACEPVFPPGWFSREDGLAGWYGYHLGPD